MEIPARELLEEDRFRQSLRQCREEQGLSMGELARRMVDAGWSDFHQATVSRIEKGQRPVRLGEARALSRLLGVHLGYMTAPNEESRTLQRFWSEIEAANSYRTKVVAYVRDWEESRGALRGLLRDMERLDVSSLLLEEGQANLEQAKKWAKAYVDEDLHALVERADYEAFGWIADEAERRKQDGVDGEGLDEPNELDE
ncbi:helix-turn-helix transcriptional regulator [Kocuria sp. KSNUG]|uniref:helix-turn-helix domain-containing protein n=1 Tax=Kocuria sp. KSNUG TaxID=3136676 RepID=UPI003C2E5FDA